VYELLSDDAAVVRAEALNTLTKVIGMVDTIGPSDVNIFPEYILPVLGTLSNDKEDSSREALARYQAREGFLL
jgi:phosphoinositide-3-kinase regulatory subunit 4